MELRFEWDDAKSRSNQEKHGVSFAEAATVFGDSLSVLIPDPLHSEEEERFALLGQSQRLLVVIHTEKEGPSASSAHVWQRQRKTEIMKKANAVAPAVAPDPEMLAEYDFRGGKRGVYAERYAQGTNLVALSPDVAAIFPDSESVNEALRALVKVARRSVKPEPRKKRTAA